MNWLYYLLEANLYLGIFYVAYHVFLSRETWYTLNRVYLLMSCVVSFILPVTQLGILKPAVHPITAVKYVTIDAPLVLAPVKDVPAAYQFTWQDGVLYGYLLGAAVLLLLLLVKLYQLLKLAQSNKKQAGGSYKLVYLNDTNTAFSFFNWLFIGTKAGGEETIIRHELVHIRQRHSADIIFLELLKIVNWFNPFIYLLQMSLRAVHEYIADEKTAIAENDALAYSTFLVNNAYGLSGPPVTHSFFNYNLLKKRIIMLNQQRSGNLARLKYLMAVPICAGLVCASTLAFSKNYVLVDLFPQPTDTGHISPPPPPAPPLQTVRLMAPPPPPEPPKYYGHTAKGYKYSLRKYTIGDKMNYVVTIYEKDGTRHLYAANSTPPVERTVLYNKYGYTFPTDGKYGAIKTVKFPPPVLVAVPVGLHKAPPPPPVPPVKAKAFVAAKRFPPPVVVKVRPVAKADTPKLAVKPLTMVHLIAPPPPFDPAFNNLYDHLSKALYYPADAKEKNIYGIVVARFSLDANNKITNVSIINSLGLSCDIAVMKGLSSYTGTISKNNQQYYTVSVSFDLIDAKDNMNLKDFDAKELGSPNYALAIPVIGSVKN